MQKKFAIPIIVFVFLFAPLNGVIEAFSGNGLGTMGSPYEITTCLELQEIVDEVDAYYILMNDIDCSATTGWNGGEGFVPIDNFSGNFDGQDFEISDLFVNRDGQGDEALFGSITSAGVVRNVHLVDVNLTGDFEMGGLAGYSEGLIENCSTSGTVTGDGTLGGIIGGNHGTINNCSSSVTVTVLGDSFTIGGFAGFNAGTIEDSYSTGIVNGHSSTGGFVGFAAGSTVIQNSYSTSEVNGEDGVGGFIGWIFGGDITNVYASGEVNGTDPATNGGLIGLLDGTITVTDSFWDSETTGQVTGSGTDSDFEAGTGVTTSEMKTIDTFSDAGWDIELSSTILNNGYPFLSWQIGDSSPIWYVNENLDADGDGVLNTVEDAGPNSGDANNDGTADSEQTNVASFVSSVSSEYVVLEANDSCDITTVMMAAESGNAVADSGFDYPAGMMSFTVDCTTPGFTADIVQYYYGVTNDSFVVRKFDPGTNAYFTVSGGVVAQTTIDSETVTTATYQATDGGVLDTDDTANGVIVDPVGLGAGSVGAPGAGFGWAYFNQL